MPKALKTMFKGELHTLRYIAEYGGLKVTQVRHRYHAGVRGDDLIAPIETYEKRTKRYATIGGKKMSLTEISKKYGIPRKALQYRHEHGVTDEHILEPISRATTEVDFKGKKVSIYVLAEKYGIDMKTIYQRYRHDKKDEELIKQPKQQEERIVSYHGKMIRVIDLKAKTRCPLTVGTIWRRHKLSGLKDDDLVRKEPLQKVLYCGRWVSFDDLSRGSRINESTLRMRFKKGDRDIDLTRPEDNHYSARYIWFCGKSMTFTEIGVKYDISTATIKKRYYAGLRDMDLVEKTEEHERHYIDRKLF